MNEKVNKILKKIILGITFCLALPLSGQTIITGTVRDKENKPIAERIITLLNATDSTIIGYAFTNNLGKYTLKTENKAKYLLISFSAFDLKNQLKKVENRSQVVDFITSRATIKLPEVVVRPPKLWNKHDTLNYLVSQFTTQKDLVIGDILKKLPGIEINGNGAISYQGTPINKFYIENMDLLQGRYNIATNNIDAHDVSMVQVLENHQPIKALKETEPSDQAAINLKLKKKAKGTFICTGLLGGGYCDEICWNEELVGMYFAKKFQRIMTYKTNNSGENVLRELVCHTPGFSIRGMNLSSMVTASPPSIGFERYNFNNCHSVTINNVNKLKNNSKINYNFMYYHDTNQKNGWSRTSYLLPGDTTRIITEEMASQTNTDYFNADCNYEKNEEKYFFNNHLKLSGNWNSGDGSIAAQRTIQQDFNNTTLKAINSTHLIKRNTNNKGIDLTMANAILTQPQYLYVTPGSYEDLLNNGNNYEGMKQSGRFNNFSSRTNLSFLSFFVFGPISVEPNIGFSVNHQALKSHLERTYQGEVSIVEDESMKNNVKWTRFNVWNGLNMKYQSRDWYLNLSIPLNYKYTLLNNNLSKQETNDKRFNILPSLYAKYTMNSSWEFKGVYGFGKSLPSLSSLYEGYILQNYRQINRFENNIYESKSQNGSFTFTYKNIFALFFMNGGISISHYNREAIANRIYDENLRSIIKMLPIENKGQSVTLSGKVTKNYDWKDLTFTLSSSWSKGRNQQMLQDQLFYYHYKNFNIGGKINITPFNWLLLEYNGSWNRYRAYTDVGNEYKPSNSMINSITADISLFKGLSLKSSFSDSYKNNLDRNQHFSFLNVGAYYSFKRMRITLDCNNILNKKHYTSYSYSAVNTYYSEYTIRPTSIMLSLRLKLF